MSEQPSSTETVTARLLILQRVCRYPGEFAPEVLAVADEWTLDENPVWWTDEVERQKTSVGADAGAWAEIEVDLPVAALHAALYPSPKVEPAAVRPVADA